MPAIVGRDGVERDVPIELNEAEKEALRRSAETLKDVLENSAGL